MSSAILGAVLAGGESRRMGTDKALVPVAGRSMLRRTVGALRAVSSEVVVVSSPGRDYALDEAKTIQDLRPGCGPLGGLHAALVHAGGRPVFALACDLPFVTPALLEHVIGDARSDGSEPREGKGGPPRVRIPLWRGRPQPLCALYSSSCLPAVEACLSARRLAMRELLRRIEVVSVAITPELPFYHPDLLLNLNRPVGPRESDRGDVAGPDRSDALSSRSS